ncbi:polyprenyl synthetase family protein, partial [Vibrio parahaemolyticus]|nr:polyprenyl synthetase family protein [Vibrio parahaemolyticus]
TCMDNDEYRSGKKTTWVAYGYDMAVLAGDALLIYAIETAAKAFAMTPDAAKVGRCIQILSEKNGYLRHDRRSTRGCGTDESADSEG